MLDDDNTDVIFNAGQVHLELNDENVDQSPSHDVRSRAQSRGSTFRRLSEGENDDFDEDNSSIDPKIISDEELLHTYWKLVVSKNDQVLNQVY